MSRWSAGVPWALSVAVVTACASPIVDDGGDDDGLVGSGGSDSGASGGGAPSVGGSASGGAPSGGAAGVGGSSGGEPSSGGSGGTSGCGAGVTVPEDFQAELKIESTNEQSAYVNGELRIVNVGPPIDPTTLRVRYYFTSEVVNKTVAVRWANSAGLTGATATIVPMQQAEATSTADYYVEFVPAGAGFAGVGVISYQMEAQNPASDQFTQSNDYSWNAAATTSTPSDKIVILRGDTVVWGVPPC